MDEILLEEQRVLEDKRKLIKNEINFKSNRLEEVATKLSQLVKEVKGSYSVEKETFKVLKESLEKDIGNYTEAINNPYFGRIDFKENGNFEETIYIGKNGISNTKDVEEIVVDWRAPVADLYYSGTSKESYYKSPKGIIEGKLETKRKFLFNNDEIEKVFDEAIDQIMVSGEEGKELVDEFLKINLEANTGKKLKEVVSTIQKEQNEIIRWPKNLPIIVQGSAGSGKTTIALHRLAYLIYRYNENLKGEDILVLAPNKLFLNYISDILPSLDVSEVKQNTFEDLMLSKLKIKLEVYDKDKKIKQILNEKDEFKKKLILNSSKVKGTLVYKKMLERFIKLIEHISFDIKDIRVKEEVLFDKKYIEKLYKNDFKMHPINKRKDEIKKYLQLNLKNKVEVTLAAIDEKYDFKVLEIKREHKDIEKRRKFLIDIYDERDMLKESVKKNAKREFNAYFKEWKSINSSDLYKEFFNNEELFDSATAGRIPKVLEQYMKSEFDNNVKNNIIDEDDLAPLYYIKILIDGISDEERFKHIVVDEVQDYSMFQLDVIRNLAIGNSLTLVGDLAQGIYYYKGINSWDELIKDVFNSEATYVQLSQSYRSTVEIIDFASKVLNSQNLNIKECKPVLRHGEKPKIIEVKIEEEYVTEIENIIKLLKENNKRSMAVITKDDKEANNFYRILQKNSKYKFGIVTEKNDKCEEDFLIIPSYLTKGLEFDCTILLNPSEDRYSESLLDKKLLYVSLTRALHMEFIIKLDSITKLI
ncbi:MULTISPECIES: RNA polymerase recycling motor HelD [Clostridium]|uniref:Helicase IV n=2 Tax=Clostridium TaxID=1485 RepID=A0ABY6SSV6_9CLOT|nr:RNA polymerase recycling motor HelD [Clostridium carnis]CAI3599776.1 putative DNA helicase, UvrD/REP type [Clostridium neonatale]CAI3623829.1 putative DNA helicase, UvrD/REP type [Clostridium neonatale]CAI3635378.1 putative DNA helicase, UvrD/REP type [Clostridium neonatale]CAI3644559.1 putative DNA helicase, UvrD/REP type [Clostridium neonatale]CAI3653030.1 putative DNA helicase, UvrD/REP type [Clostridium neonatale]